MDPGFKPRQVRTEKLQWSLSMEFCRQEYWSGLPFPPPGDLANPGVEPESPALQVDFLFFTIWATRDSGFQVRVTHKKVCRKVNKQLKVSKVFFFFFCYYICDLLVVISFCLKNIFLKSSIFRLACNKDESTKDYKFTIILDHLFGAYRWYICNISYLWSLTNLN